MDDREETTHRMYGDLAPWFHLLTAPEDYAEEAELFRRALVETAAIPIRSVLELGSGGGCNASHMKRHFTMTLVDRAPGMLALSRSLNPECEHIEGDMRSVRLGRRFDAVFLHDAVMYMTTEADLRASMETAFVHCRPGGVALFVPDHTRETFRPKTSHGGHDAVGAAVGDSARAAGIRAMRYLEWSFDPDPSDDTTVTEFAYLLRDESGAVRSAHERHVTGLFATADWLRWLSAAGFIPLERPFGHSELEPGSWNGFLGLKPAPTAGP